MTPDVAVSTAVASVSPRIPPLPATYEASFGMAHVVPDVDVTLTMRPKPRDVIPGITARVTRKAVSRLRMIPLRHCSGVISVIDSQLSSSVTLVMPALLTSRSIGPRAASTSPTSCLTCSASVRSAMNPFEPPPSSAARSWMRSDVAATATVAPNDSKRLRAGEPDAIRRCPPR